jgi:signal transduction histidine kinase
VHGPLTDTQRNALTRVTANQRHLLTLINDVLAFAKLEAGQVEFDLRPLLVADLLASMDPLVAALAHAKGIALSIQDGASPLRLIGDEERVRQILLNLVGNAIKYTPEGGWVVLTGESDGMEVAIRVRDNGPGISPEQQQQIFDPFVQVDRRLNHPQEGVGLGLAISRDLARAMGGDLHVESTPGEGSAFTLRLTRVP